MKEVTKEQFKEIYFKHRGSGWSLDYWNKFFEEEKKNGNEVSNRRTKNPRTYKNDDRY